MMKYLLSLLCLAVLTACGKNDGPTPDPDDLTTHRTVLVYMVADNTLGTTWGCDQADLDEMLKAAGEGALNGGRLIVYHNRPGTTRGKVPQLLEVTKNGLVTLKEYPDDPMIYSVDPERMQEVIADTKQLAPAKDYGLVLWSHANSWLENMGSNDEGNYRGGRAFGDDRGKHMKLTTLASTLDGNYFSFIYFDCCLMGTVEVAYEMRKLTPVIVASPTELPIDGMPYDRNLSAFFVNGLPDMLLAARNTYEWYSEPDAIDPYCQMVVINTDGLPDLADASRAIFSDVTSYPTSTTGIQKYVRSGAGKCYIYDFKEYMTMASEENNARLAAFNAAFDATVAGAYTTSMGIGSLVIRSYNGLGSHIILSADDVTYRGYNNCAWYREVVAESPLYRLPD